MMDLTTPALLFPAISLLFLAYTNRFLVLAQLIRELNQREGDNVRQMARRQIDNLRRRIVLIKVMQAFGVLSFVLCTAAMFCLFMLWQIAVMAIGLKQWCNFSMVKATFFAALPTVLIFGIWALLV